MIARLPAATHRRGRRRWPVAAAAALLVGAAGCGMPFGIYHEVLPGQTLYRIAQVYDVPVGKLVKINRIDDPTRVRAGDMIFIPGADRRREVPTTAAPTADGGGGSGRRAPPASPSPRTRGETVRIDGGRSGAAKSTWTGGAAPVLIWPVAGTISSGFGRRGGEHHDGIDIAAPKDAPVAAAADGRVIYADDGIAGYGNMVIIRHTGSWATVYAHNDRLLVRKGQFVAQGETIARVGDTGRASAPHLHFEVRFGKSPRDPLQYLPDPPKGR